MSEERDEAKGRYEAIERDDERGGAGEGDGRRVVLRFPFYAPFPVAHLRRLGGVFFLSFRSARLLLVLFYPPASYRIRRRGDGMG